MSKKELFRSLTAAQKAAVEELIDKAYIKGYDSGRFEERIVENYDRF